MASNRVAPLTHKRVLATLDRMGAGYTVDSDGDILSIDLGSTTVSLGRAYVVSVMDPRSKAVKEEK